MRKILVFRLSSLGDLILATASLRALPKGTSVDWVVEKRFQEVLEGHPSIQKLLVFDRSSGFKGWIRFLREIDVSSYDEVWDLHRTWRTWAANLLFPFARWKKISKERFRTWAYFLCKGLWPKWLRPRPWVVRYSRFSDPQGLGRPDFRHWKSGAETTTKKIAVMPSSAWRTKEWPTSNLVALLKKLNAPLYILGKPEDPTVSALTQALTQEGIPFEKSDRSQSIREIAGVLSESEAYLGMDTGFAHLAQSLGIPAWVVMGPTAPDAGFGPWEEGSRALTSHLWCSPCGKTGKYCIRPIRRRLCLTDLWVPR